jgi:chemotaxis response regulator CheB
MNKNLLVIGEMKMSVQEINALLGHNAKVNVSQTTQGNTAYQTIREVNPEMVLVNLETPGLATSWTAMQLEGVHLAHNIPVVATSGTLSSEEMEILSDITGARVWPDSVPNKQLGAVIKHELLQ